MMEAASTYGTSVNFYQTTRRNIPEDIFKLIPRSTHVLIPTESCRYSEQVSEGNFPTDFYLAITLYREERTFCRRGLVTRHPASYKCSKLRSTGSLSLPYSARKHPLAISQRETHPAPLFAQLEVAPNPSIL
jgi:hypothetical protein